MAVGGKDARTSVVVALVFGLIAAWWGANLSGIVSSNDGSHVALGRALLRGETSIDPDVALTLRVDLARAGGAYRSDRPPGTALGALPALALGGAMDAALAAESQARHEPVFPPGSDRYILTYAARAPGWGGAPTLVNRIGTATAAAVQAVVVGLCALGLLWRLLAMAGASLGACVFAVLALGLGSSFGSYSTVLFSHGSTAMWALACAWACLVVRQSCEVARGDGSVTARGLGPALGLGFTGAMTIASDYLTVVAIVPIVVLLVPVSRSWLFALVGALPVALFVAGYHADAFGNAFSVGYDHHVNFQFARQRGSTFAGDPLAGAWTLLGAGSGGGLLALAPVFLVGFVAVGTEAVMRRWLLGWIPWALLLFAHLTPAGGASEDHRYLVPALPVAAYGLGVLWDRFGVPGRALLCIATSVGAFTTWAHFFAWRGPGLLTTPALGLASGLAAALIAGVISWSRRPTKTP